MIFLSSVTLRIIFLSFHSLSLLDVFPYKPDIFKKQEEWAAPRMSFKSIQLEIVSLVEQKQNFEAKKKEKKKKSSKTGIISMMEKLSRTTYTYLLSLVNLWDIFMIDKYF